MTWVQTQVEPNVFRQSAVSAVIRRHQGVFGSFLGHRNRVRVAHELSYILHFRWFGLLRPQFAIYWIFLGSGRLEKKLRPHSGPKTNQKRRKGGFSRSWGPFWANRPPTKFDRMRNPDAVNPVWSPMCPWGTRYGHSGGAWGPFPRFGTSFVG